MFSVAEIETAMLSVAFTSDAALVRQSLAQARFRQASLLRPDVGSRLAYLVNATLASIPKWVNCDAAMDLARRVAELAEGVADSELLSDSQRRLMAVKAAILYEFAQLPAMAQAVAMHHLSEDSRARMFFVRGGSFRRLNDQEPGEGQRPSAVPLGFAAVYEDFRLTARFVQGQGVWPDNLLSEQAWRVATILDVGLPANVVEGMGIAIRTRFRNATRSQTDPALFSLLGRLRFPCELWRSQIEALTKGLLDGRYDAWGLAAPTGSGKTFICRLLLAEFFRTQPAQRAIYLVPTRALVHEVTTDLDKFLAPLQLKVTAVTPHLSPLDGEEASQLQVTDLAILTPEKADLLLRLGSDFLHEVRLVIVDEAHLIESETRGVLLELYLWRIRKLLGSNVRLVFLSAVAPNVAQLAMWTGRNPGHAVVHQRPTRMRAGVFRWKLRPNILGEIDFSDQTKVTVPGRPQKSVRLLLVHLARQTYSGGPVLIVCKGKAECEKLAGLMVQLLAREATPLVPMDKEVEELRARLDSRLEREMYSEVPLRGLFRQGVVYHHAGLPPRVRHAIEDLIRHDGAPFVFSTTTLAEGVNFPFASVIVQSLAIREPPERGVMGARFRPITVRSFWNIAGRAGRPGYEREGQVILFEPTLGTSKVDITMAHYLNPDHNSVGPVVSAISKATNVILDGIRKNRWAKEDLGVISIPHNVPKQVRGMINLFRVGLVHTRAARIASSPEEIVEGSFAAYDLKTEERKALIEILAQQNALLDSFLGQEAPPSVKDMAEIGISLETFEALREYAGSRENFEIESYNSQLFYGPRVNPEKAKFIIAPVAKRMTELDGSMLGGHLATAIVQWLSGVPLFRFPTILPGSFKSLEQMISVIYSRVQYLLPWGLFAFDRVIAAEAKLRGLEYGHQIERLAQLADQGVPSFDALRLVRHEFERVDATRLADTYYAAGGLKSTGLDVLDWVIGHNIEYLERIVNGTDKRKIDYDFRATVAALKAAPRSSL